MHNKLQDPRPDEAMVTKTEGIFAEEHKVYHNVVIIILNSHLIAAHDFLKP